MFSESQLVFFYYSEFASAVSSASIGASFFSSSVLAGFGLGFSRMTSCGFPSISYLSGSQIRKRACKKFLLGKKVPALMISSYRSTFSFKSSTSESVMSVLISPSTSYFDIVFYVGLKGFFSSRAFAHFPMKVTLPSRKLLILYLRTFSFVVKPRAMSQV